MHQLYQEIRINLLLAALNDLDVLTGDIGNAYLSAPCEEKVHVITDKHLFGPENNNKTAIIVRALYGLKSTRHSWRHHLAERIITELG